MKDAIYRRRNRFTWSLLAFQGGYINAAAFVTVHLFVSHITGFATLAANAIEQFEMDKAFYFLMAPGFFLFGAFLTGVFVSVRRTKNQTPEYFMMMLLLTILYLGMAVLGEMSLIGEFAKPSHSFNDFVIVGVLAFSCGLQNALFTHYSGSIVRTTHLTGLSTDLGIGLAKVLMLGDLSEWQANHLRIELIISFLLGSISAVYMFSHFQYGGFYVPAGVSFFIANWLRK